MIFPVTEKHCLTGDASFCAKKEVVMARTPLNIYCPQCNRKVATWDGKSSMNLAAKCGNCKKLIVFDPILKTTTQKDLPFRATSSGKTFI